VIFLYQITLKLIVMKKIYSFIIIAFFLFPLAANSIAQEEPDSVKLVTLLRVKSSKPDNNWAGKGTALCDAENDLLAQISVADFTLGSEMIDSAMLRIFFKAPAAKGDLALYDMDPNWVDTSATWNSVAGLTVSDTPFATMTIDQDDEAHYWVNVTDYIKTAIDKGVDFGWRIKSVDGTAAATARTSYHDDPLMQPTIFIYEKEEVVAVDLGQAVTLSVYPNPASDYIRVELNEVVEGKVNVYNVVGTRVLQKQIDSENMQIDLTSLNPGMYFISVGSEVHSSRATKILVR
jgi:hypothetical protein